MLGLTSIIWLYSTNYFNLNQDIFHSEDAEVVKMLGSCGLRSQLQGQDYAKDLKGRARRFLP